MIYYVYMNEEVKGPFTLSALQENLNAGVWGSDILCCQAGKNVWSPLGALFQVRFVPVGESMIAKVTKKTQELAIRAFYASPLKRLVPIPPAPTNGAGIRSVASDTTPDVHGGFPQDFNMPAHTVPPVLMQTPRVLGVAAAPVVIRNEALGIEHYVMIIGILGIAWGLYYILVKSVSG